jgi:Fe-S-cluster containining protein
LWQVSHDHVNVYKDEDGWTLLIDGKCQHLQVNGDCGIYQTRPTICREHSNDYCEYDAPSEDGFDLYFRNYEELLAYCRKRFKRWD